MVPKDYLLQEFGTLVPTQATVMYEHPAIFVIRHRKLFTNWPDGIIVFNIRIRDK